MSTTTDTRSLRTMIPPALVMSAVTLWPPIVVGGLLVGVEALSLFVFGALIGLVNTLHGGVRVGVATSFVFALITPVALVVGTSPLAGACLMALACIAVGGSALWKRYSGFFEIALAMAFLMSAMPTVVGQESVAMDSRDLTVAMLATGLSALWAVAGTHLIHRGPGVPTSMKNPGQDTLRYTVMLTLLVSGSMYYVLASGRDTHGIWLVLTLFMILQVGSQSTWHRIFHRVAGTVLGAGVAALIVSFATQPWMIVVAGLLAMLGVTATVGKQPYAVFTFFVTVLVLILVTPADDVEAVTLDRIGYTLIAALLATGALAALKQWPTKADA